MWNHKQYDNDDRRTSLPVNICCTKYTDTTNKDKIEHEYNDSVLQNVIDNKDLCISAFGKEKIESCSKSGLIRTAFKIG